MSGHSLRSRSDGLHVILVVRERFVEQNKRDRGNSTENGCQ
jgi:hypothetical protein